MILVKYKVTGPVLVERFFRLIPLASQKVQPFETKAAS